MKTSFNQIHKEHLHKLSEIRDFYSRYNVSLARKRCGVYDEKIEDIEGHINEVAEHITYVISQEMLESEYFNHETKEEVK